MRTDIEYLRQLETDLHDAAGREVARKARTPRRGRRGRADQGRWTRTVGAAAAMLTLAWGIGFVAQGGLRDTFTGADDTAASSAASGTSAAEVPGEPTIREQRNAGSADAAATWSAGLDDERAALGLQSYATPSAAPAPMEQHAGGGGAIADNGMAKIVRDGSLSLTIPDGTFDPRFQRLFEIAAANGGFVLSSETRGPSTGGVIMRIPAENFDQAILQVRELGTVTASQVNGSDVTAEYIDLDARLQILEARRTALLTLLAEANGIGEILAVQNRVDDVQLEIEKIQGRLRYLDSQVDESTLRVDMRERSSEEPQQQQEDEGVDNPSLGRAWDLAVQGTMNVIATVIVGIGYLLPLAIIGLMIFGVVRLARRRDRGAS